MAAMRSKECWIRKRNTAKNTRRNTTSFTPGKDWLPSMRCDISMSFKVNTSPRTPQPMGSTATCQTPLAMSYMETSPALASMVSNGADSTPLAPSERITSV